MKAAHKIFLYLIVLLLTILVYSNAVNNGFVNWDDDVTVELNQDIRGFEKQHLINMFNNSYNGMYQPVVMLSYALNYAIHELKPAGYHMTNLIFHLLNVILVIVFVRLLFGNEWLSLFTAVVFAVHPMHVESVSWITERKDVVYAFFFLLSLIMYLKYLHQNEKKGFLYLSLVFYLLSLFSKTSAVMLPFIMMVLDWYFKRPLNKKLIYEKLILLLFAFIFGLIAVKSQQLLDEGAFKTIHYNFADRIVIAMNAFAFYVHKFFLPLNLSALYPFPMKSAGFLPLQYYLTVIVLIVILLAAYFFFRKKSIPEMLKRQLILTFAFFLLSVSIVLFIPVGKAFVADRYTYIPYIGLSMFVFLFASLFLNKIKKWGVFISILIIVTIFSVLSYQRNKVWKDSGTLWSDVISKQPDAYIAYYGRGNYRQSQKDFSGAMIDFNKAINIYPDFALALNNRGAVKLYLNDLNGALIDLNRSIILNPKDKWAYYNRALVYLSKNIPQLACIDLNKAVKLGNAEANLIIEKFCR